MDFRLPGCTSFWASQLRRQELDASVDEAQLQDCDDYLFRACGSVERIATNPIDGESRASKVAKSE